MTTVNSLSSGESSSFLAVQYPADFELFSLVCISDLASKPKDKHVVDYVNRKLEKFVPEFGEFVATAEDDMSLQVMMDLEQYIGREIHWVRGMSFDDVIDKGTQTRLPSWARRYCTEKMKLLPIFLWWWNNLYNPNIKGFGKCEMRIGFRFDEFDRMLRFFNNSDPTNFRIPTNCKTYGEQKQVFEDFNWRFCSFPLIKNGIIKDVTHSYWEENGYVGGDLFTELRKMLFPVISNCVGCFHKDEETIAVEAIINLSKVSWFARQEMKDMGTWLDSRVTYQHIIDNKETIAKERLYEMKVLKQSCDTGGCND